VCDDLVIRGLLELLLAQRSMSDWLLTSADVACIASSSSKVVRVHPVRCPSRRRPSDEDVDVDTMEVSVAHLYQPVIPWRPSSTFAESPMYVLQEELFTETIVCSRHVRNCFMRLRQIHPLAAVHYAVVSGCFTMIKMFEHSQCVQNDDDHLGTQGFRRAGPSSLYHPQLRWMPPGDGYDGVADPSRRNPYNGGPQPHIPPGPDKLASMISTHAPHQAFMKRLQGMSIRHPTLAYAHTTVNIQSCGRHMAASPRGLFCPLCDERAWHPLGPPESTLEIISGQADGGRILVVTDDAQCARALTALAEFPGHCDVACIAAGNVSDIDRFKTVQFARVIALMVHTSIDPRASDIRSRLLYQCDDDLYVVKDSL